MFKEITRTDNRGATKSLIYGVGINDAPYKTTLKAGGLVYLCPYYNRWYAMLTRCYSPRWLAKNPSYVGCAVAPEWHSFMEFKKWMMGQNWKNMHLDKDLLSFDAKIYSSETCLFVTPQVNSLFLTGVPNKTGLPLGIYFRKGKYEVGVSTGKSKRTWVGRYSTVSEAIDAYIQAKKSIVNTVIKSTHDIKTKSALTAYLKYYTDKLECLKAVY